MKHECEGTSNIYPEVYVEFKIKDNKMLWYKYEIYEVSDMYDYKKIEITHCPFCNETLDDKTFPCYLCEAETKPEDACNLQNGFPLCPKCWEDKGKTWSYESSGWGFVYPKYWDKEVCLE